MNSTRRPVVGPIPRSASLGVKGGEQRPVRFRAPQLPHVGGTFLLRRRLQWLAAGLYFLRMQIWNTLRRPRRIGGAEPDDHLEKYHWSASLPGVFRRVGGTGVKLGQQLSMRMDLLPWQTCRELEGLLEDVDPIPFDVARACIEDALGGPLDQHFARVDPTPIGSASVACVYLAELKDGRRVAVKVRRPGIERLFAADLRILGSIFGLVEYLTIVDEGFFEGPLAELTVMLEEELDFVREARYQYLFRKQLKRDKIRFMTSPKVVHSLSNERVMVSEYIEGLMLAEVLLAAETEDPDALARLRALDINPKLLAKRLMYASFWGPFEALFFHADPHPANIIVQPGSKLVFLDFGACGVPSRNTAIYHRQALEALMNDDLGQVVEAFLHTLEPLPPIDVDRLAIELEARSSTFLMATHDKHAQWWERTSAGFWILLFKVVRSYKVTVHADTVRLIRSSLLYDTLAARLWPRAGMQLYSYYSKRAQKRHDRMVRKRWLDAGPEETRQQLLNMWDQSVTRFHTWGYFVDRLIERPLLSQVSSITKGLQILMLGLSLLKSYAWIAFLFILAVVIDNHVSDESAGEAASTTLGSGDSAQVNLDSFGLGWTAEYLEEVANPWYLIVIPLLLLRSWLAIRRAKERISDLRD